MTEQQKEQRRYAMHRLPGRQAVVIFTRFRYQGVSRGYNGCKDRGRCVFS